MSAPYFKGHAAFKVFDEKMGQLIQYAKQTAEHYPEFISDAQTMDKLPPSGQRLFLLENMRADFLNNVREQARVMGSTGQSLDRNGLYDLITNAVQGIVVQDNDPLNLYALICSMKASAAMFLNSDSLSTFSEAENEDLRETYNVCARLIAPTLDLDQDVVRWVGDVYLQADHVFTETWHTLWYDIQAGSENLGIKAGDVGGLEQVFVPPVFKK